jgi:hypothetical protein
LANVLECEDDEDEEGCVIMVMAKMTCRMGKILAKQMKKKKRALGKQHLCGGRIPCGDGK